MSGPKRNTRAGFDSSNCLIDSAGREAIRAGKKTAVTFGKPEAIAWAAEIARNRAEKETSV